MRLVVSPYHLTTREPAAMASLLLADSVCTLMPAPAATNGHGAPAREDLGRAVRSVPRYLAFMRSWEWTVALWEAGVISAAPTGSDLPGDLRAVCAAVARDDRFGAIRPLLRPDVFDDEDAYLDAVSRDVLRGGPDPAILLPVSAAIDRLAARHGMAAARGEPVSIAQRAEARMAAPVFTIIVPVLLRASAARLLEARRLLAPQLAALRAAIDAATDDPGAEEPALALRRAARAYAQAFEARRDRLLARDEDEVRPVEGTVSIASVVLPADAVLASSDEAMRTATHTRAGPAASGASTLAERGVVAWIIRPLGSKRA